MLNMGVVSAGRKTEDDVGLPDRLVTDGVQRTRPFFRRLCIRGRRPASCGSKTVISGKGAPWLGKSERSEANTNCGEERSDKEA